MKRVLPKKETLDVDVQHIAILPYILSTNISEVFMRDERTDILNGTLALMTLRTIDALGPIHGYGIARRIEQVSQGVLELNQGTLYPMLLNLEQAGWITSKWGISDTGRKAKFYSITRAGKKQLAAETENWRKISDVVERFADPKGDLA
jgi:PadR family transcriptional regulator